jgi:hypothetical protein
VPLADKSEQEIKALEDALLAEVRRQGGKAGNILLQRELKWDGDTYWAVHERLINSKRLRPYRARGGAVAIIEAGAPPELAQELSTEGPYDQASASKERDLYEPVANVLQSSWSKDQGFRQHLVEITASKGSKHTGGTWTRPDIVVVAFRIFPFLPGRYLDVITFEIKPKTWIDVTAVYEALAHRRAATQAYVWLHCPKEERALRAEVLERITEEAERHGVGVIVASSPAEATTWETLVDAERKEPDPEALNEFIDVQLSEPTKRELSLWAR